MRRLRVWLLLAATLVLLGVGIWYFERDEYPFQVSAGDISGMTYQVFGTFGSVSGDVLPPPGQLADWIDAMQRDSNGETIVTDSVLLVTLRDGRQLRFSLGPIAGYGAWVVDGVAGERIGVDIGKPFAQYLAGLAAGLRAEPRLLVPSPSSSVSPSPPVGPSLSPSP